jgi:hypothetical protein
METPTLTPEKWDALLKRLRALRERTAARGVCIDTVAIVREHRDGGDEEAGDSPPTEPAHAMTGITR